MNQHSRKQIMAIMAPYNKKGIPFRAKQVKRLIEIFDDIFQHEPNVGEQIQSVGFRQLTGYFRRINHESLKTRKEKFKIIRLFYEMANIQVRLPELKD